MPGMWEGLQTACAAQATSAIRASTLVTDPWHVSQALVRSFSSSTRSHLENRVAEKQKLFQADNDLPVHLKGGGMDNVLYRLTMTLTLGGKCRTTGLLWS